MSSWDDEQRKFTVEAYFKHGESAKTAQRTFRKHFNDNRHGRVPSRATILKWVDNYKFTGSPKKLEVQGNVEHMPELVESKSALVQSKQVPETSHSSPRRTKEKRKKEKKSKTKHKDKIKGDKIKKYIHQQKEALPGNHKDEPDFFVPIELMNTTSHAPETPEEYRKRQSKIRREVDPVTGRSRLIKGDGEILEEIVSKERHREINKQATEGDGTHFMKTVGVHIQ